MSYWHYWHSNPGAGVYYGRRCFGRGRFLWFFIGAATAVWWQRRHDGHLCGGNRQNGRIDYEGAAGPSSSDRAPGVLNAPTPTRLTPSSTEWWDKEKQRLIDVGKQANETATELSESAIDAVLAKLQLLKKKLAEDRIQRDRAAADAKQR